MISPRALRNRAILHPAFAGPRIVQMDYLGVGRGIEPIDGGRRGRAVFRDKYLVLAGADLRREARDQARQRFGPRVGRDNDR